MGGRRTQLNKDKKAVSDFRIRLYPELRYVKTRNELREIKFEFQKRQNKKFPTLIIGLVPPVAMYAGSHLSDVFAPEFAAAGIPQWSVLPLTMGLAVLLTWFTYFVFWHRPYTRFLREYLRKRGIIVCFRCGYDLRGQTEPRCPECGFTFAPELLSQTRGI